MATSMKSYPHPVLGNSSDIAGQFNPSYGVSSDPESITINYSFALKQPTIQSLIDEHNAAFVVQVQCRNTFYRNAFSVSESEGVIVIPADRLRDEVRVDFYICATVDIKDYRPDGLQEDYANLSFFVEGGDILAEGGHSTFNALKSFDALRAPLNSVIDIDQGNFEEGPMRIDYEKDETVTILLSQSDWKAYQQARTMQATIHAAIVLPALVDILYELKNRPDDYAEKMWAKRLKEMCLARKYNDEDPLEAAQKLLVNPIARSFTEYTTELSEDLVGDTL